MFNKLVYATISSRGLSHRLSSKPLAAPFLQTRNVVVRPQREPSLRKEFPLTKSAFSAYFITNTRGFRSDSSARTREGWLAWLGKNKKKTIGVATVCMLAYLYFTSEKLPRVVTAGAQVLHQPAREVYPGEIGSARVDKVIHDLVKVMRKQDIISLSAPQIGVPLRIIVLEDRKLCTALFPNKVNDEQDRLPSDLVVILNPKLKEKSNKTELFFEDCVSVFGYAAIVERFLEVEVTGLDQDGQPINVDASGWQARILQHECDHLDGILYVDKMVKRTFGTLLNHKLRLAKGLPQQRVR